MNYKLSIDRLKELAEELQDNRRALDALVTQHDMIMEKMINIGCNAEPDDAYLIQNEAWFKVRAGQNDLQSVALKVAKLDVEREIAMRHRLRTIY